MNKHEATMETEDQLNTFLNQASFKVTKETVFFLTKHQHFPSANWLRDVMEHYMCSVKTQ